MLVLAYLERQLKEILPLNGQNLAYLKPTASPSDTSPVHEERGGSGGTVIVLYRTEIRLAAI